MELSPLAREALIVGATVTSAASIALAARRAAPERALLPWIVAAGVALAAALLILPARPALAIALAFVSLALRMGARPWERALAGAPALAALALSPAVGACAVALCVLATGPRWRAMGELVLAAAVIVFAHGVDASPRLGAALVGATLAAALATRLPNVVRVPPTRALGAIAAAAGALALLVLLVVDDRRSLVPGEAVWTALGIGLVAALAGAIAGIAAFGTLTILATSGPARPLLLASAAAALAAAGVAGPLALALLLPAGALSGAVGGLRTLRAVYPPSPDR